MGFCQSQTLTLMGRVCGCGCRCLLEVVVLSAGHTINAHTWTRQILCNASGALCRAQQSSIHRNNACQSSSALGDSHYLGYMQMYADEFRRAFVVVPSARFAHNRSHVIIMVVNVCTSSKKPQTHVYLLKADSINLACHTNTRKCNPLVH